MASRKSKKSEFLEGLVLPSVHWGEVFAVSEWLKSRQRSQRSPLAAAQILVLVVKLDQAKMPWPGRRRVAEHLGVSRPTVDVTLSQRQAQKLIFRTTRKKPGHNPQRATVVTYTHYEPYPELRQVVLGA